MTIQTERRALLAGLLGATGLASLPRLALAQDPSPTPEPEAAPEATPAAEAPAGTKAEYLLGDQPIGSADAPVTVIEYLSLTCPHCASFAVHSWPTIKKDYVDTGKVRWIVREVYFDKFGLWATMAARCGNEATYHAMVDQFLAKQQVWARADDIAEAIRKVARLNGLPEDRIEACLSDADFARKLVETFQEQAKADAVESTPTFIINGEKVSGDMPAEDFAKILDTKL